MRICVVIVAALAVSSAVAHHSFNVQYDVNNMTSVRGIVTKVEWTNPHVYFYVDAFNEEDEELVEEWAFEMLAPAALEGRGWTRHTLAIGEYIQVEGALSRDGSNLASANVVTFLNTGKVMRGFGGPPPR